MTTSLFELFKIGIGPSSSHTVGPMLAAWRFVQNLEANALLERTVSVKVEIYGSLALTGHGHATDKALCLGLMGHLPSKINPDIIPQLLEKMRLQKKLLLFAHHEIEFDEQTDLIFKFGEFLEQHPNALIFKAFDCNHAQLFEKTYYSIGGGFVMDQDEMDQGEVFASSNQSFAYPFNNAKELLQLCETHQMTIAQIMFENEKSLRHESEIIKEIDLIITAMESSIERGLSTDGVLPGGLNVQRRACKLAKKLEKSNEDQQKNDQLSILDWVNVFALAVNEENAAGGRVVTAPTNGAAGIIPAVLSYYKRFVTDATQKGARDFLLTATAIGALYKKNASISAAEVGCQGEVGVACSMAAGALCAVLGGTIKQIENAAEIGMEHNLGLTCDPIKGLVQVPCIERNTMGAVKAINAARLALAGDGQHMVSLDQVIATMLQTGRDMQSNYKETSSGGLAVNFVAC